MQNPEGLTGGFLSLVKHSHAIAAVTLHFGGKSGKFCLFSGIAAH